MPGPIEPRLIVGDKALTREDGYYWIRLSEKTDWEVAHYSGGRWRFDGSDIGIGDEQVFYVDATRIVRDITIKSNTMTDFRDSKVVGVKPPELRGLLDFLQEINDKNDKVLSEIGELCSKLMPMEPIVRGNEAPEQQRAGALGDLHAMIVRANMLHDRLYQIKEHLSKIV